MTSAIAEGYLRFAEVEARGRSPLYEQMAIRVAESPASLGFLATLPPSKRQPNLLFAATRLVCGLPQDAEDFEGLLRRNAGPISRVMLERTTQTNEPGRCASLMPALARIEGPLSLIEVGASAGLCLLPDRYGYTWGAATLRVDPSRGPQPPVFPCAVSGTTPLPTRYPEIVWRRGLDLNPLDVRSTQDVAWLETLVWPEDVARLKRLRAAIEVAKTAPAQVVEGDLRSDLARLIASAPAGSTVVVFHTAVLSYLRDARDREDFRNAMLASGADWICNESPRVFPDLAARAGSPPSGGLFLMSFNGTPVAWTGPHGQSVHWL